MNDLVTNAYAFSNNESNRTITFDGGPPEAFGLVVGIWLPGIFCVLGIVGNSVSLIVLSADRSNSASFLSLKALSLSDIALLSSALLQQVIPVYSHIIGCANSFCRHLGYIRVYTWPVICIAQMSSIWLTVLVSTERYIAICTPLRSKNIRNVPRMRLAIFGTIFAAVIFNVPKFFEFQAIHRFDVEKNATFVELSDTEMRHHIVYRYAYNTALYGLFLFVMPLSILAMLNISIVRDMRQARRRWDSLNRIQQRELKATTIPLCIVVVFFISGTLSFIAFVLDAVFVDISHTFLQIFTAVVNLIVVMNSAINFVIFYMFGSKFRKLCRHVLLCQRFCQTGGSPIVGTPILVRQFRRPRLNRMSLETSNSVSEEIACLRPLTGNNNKTKISF